MKRAGCILLLALSGCLDLDQLTEGTHLDASGVPTDLAHEKLDVLIENVDLAGVDLAGADLAVPTDLALPPTLDLSSAIDSSTVKDLATADASQCGGDRGACANGVDPVSGSKYVICGNGNPLRIAGPGPGNYFIDEICHCYGLSDHVALTEDFQGACGGSCANPGMLPNLPPPVCMVDMMGRFACNGMGQTIEWTCGK